MSIFVARKWLGILVALLMVPTYSVADSNAALVVSLDEGLERGAARVFHNISNAMENLPGYKIVNLASVAEGQEVLTGRTVDLNRARDLYRRGMVAYEEFQFTESIHALEDSLEAFRRSRPIEHFREFLDSYSLLSAALYFNGDVREARAIIEKILTLQPDYSFDMRLFPQDMKDVAENIRTEIEQSSNNPIEVVVEGLPASVYVNGCFQGVSPIEVTGLPRGEHYVVARYPGYALLQEKAVASPGSLLRASMTPAADGARFGDLESNLKSAFRRGSVSASAMDVAKWAGLSEVLVVAVHGSPSRMGVELVRVASDGHILAIGSYFYEPGDTESGARLARRVQELFSSDLPRGSAGEPRTSNIKIASSFNRTKYGVLLSGASAGVAAGAAFMGFRASLIQKSARELPQTHQEQIEDRIGSAKRSALVADILYGTALVGGVVGFYMVAPALKPQPAEPTGRGIREEWFSISSLPSRDGAMVTVGGRF